MTRDDLIDKVIGFLRGRKKSYQLAFGSPAGQEVLVDLARFCRAAKTCFHADPRLHAAAEGRREVYLRIEQHIKLSPEQLAVVYEAAALKQPGEP